MSNSACIGLLLLVAVGAEVPCRAAEIWRVRFSPKGGTRLSINDLKFVSPTRGIAVGRLVEGRRSTPISVITSDGGKTWRMAATPETGLSLFFPAETAGWMVTSSGLWKTSDGGGTWSKLPPSIATENATQVHFLDANRGWVIGPRKAIHRTDDGGMNWTPVVAAREAPGSTEHTSFDCMAFVGGRFGLIAGASFPPQPQGKDQRRELPHLSIFLNSNDGGETWNISTTSMFGRVTRIQFAPDGRGIGLIEFRRDFDFPSEVFSIEWKTGKSTRAFRRADCAVTDVAVAPQGQAWLASIDVGARGPAEGARGRVKFFYSADFVEWTEAQVDRRCLGRRSFMALTPDGQLWSATDEGSILQHVIEPKHD